MINIPQSALTRSQIKKFVLPYKTREGIRRKKKQKRLNEKSIPRRIKN